jgi:hypothetical protein
MQEETHDATIYIQTANLDDPDGHCGHVVLDDWRHCGAASR